MCPVENPLHPTPPLQLPPFGDTIKNYNGSASHKDTRDLAEQRNITKCQRDAEGKRQTTFEFLTDTIAELKSYTHSHTTRRRRQVDDVE